MNHRFILAVVFFLSLTMANAESVKTVRLSFNKQQFSFTEDEVGALEVSVNSLSSGYGSDYSQPGLPLIAVNVGIPEGTDFRGISTSIIKQQIYDNVVVAANPIAVPTSYEGALPKKTMPMYAEGLYPNENVQYVCTSTMDGYTILRFLVCPFKYDSRNKKLFLTTGVTLRITLTDTPSTMSNKVSQRGQNMKELFMSQIVNPEDFEEPQISTQGFDIVPGLNLELDPNKHITERYLIITSNALAPSFEPLAKWKTTKGIKAKIATVEDVTALHPDMDAQLAIKTYIYDEYKNNKLKYVLLGGDDSVVPVRGCYGRVLSQNNAGESIEITDKAIPTDLYYACFDKCFSWDANRNGIFGEYDDSISFDPSVFVTRAPVRTSADVECCINKILGYEKVPTRNGWDNNILMTGRKKSEYYENSTVRQSDAEYKGNILYKYSIAPYWNGTRTRFYDTATDFQGNSDYNLNATNLQEQLSKGYTFMEMATHGNYDLWVLENGLYLNNDANTLRNNKYTIITTTACNTNAFDYSVGVESTTEHPCLSECFIRNPQSGIVAYLGCSRFGWDHKHATSLGTSYNYEQNFYKALFSSDFKTKNFGVIVSKAKQQRANLLRIYNATRWVQFGLNPIGDPEMPIYTDTPKRFENVSIKYSTDKKSITIDTGVDSCGICFMSAADNGESDYLTLRYARKATFQISRTTSICITKQNYIPYTTTMTYYIDRPSIITQCLANSSDNTAMVSTQLADDAKEAKVIITPTIGNMHSEHTVSADTPTVSADISAFPNGVLSVSLFVDGKIVDSRNIIKK